MSSEPNSGPLPVWVVELQGPKRKRHYLEVPSYQGQEAAERRALVSAWAMGLGDVDEVTVVASWLDERDSSDPSAEIVR